MNKIILSYPIGYNRIYLKGVLLPLSLAYLLLLCLFFCSSEFRVQTSGLISGIADQCGKTHEGVSVYEDGTALAVSSEAGGVYVII